jgi:hypothetical protein
MKIARAMADAIALMHRVMEMDVNNEFVLAPSQDRANAIFRDVLLGEYCLQILDFECC